MSGLQQQIDNADTWCKTCFLKLYDNGEIKLSKKIVSRTEKNEEPYMIFIAGECEDCSE